MKQAFIEEKILGIQNEIEIIKKFFVKDPDFGVDKKNWANIQPEVKKVRKNIYKKFYGKK